MNSANLRSSDKTSSPLTDPAIQQSGDSKSNWNTRILIKDDEPLNIDQADSPELESLEVIEPQSSAFKPSRQTGFQGKRLKIDNGENESVDGACHFVTDVIQDDCDAFGRCVTAQLRQMTKMQKFLSQRLISEILFRGQVQALHMTTVLNNQSTVFQLQPQQAPLPVYTPRPAHLNRGSDYNLMIHQQSLRHQTHMPVSVTTVGTNPPPYQNYATLSQQSEHVTSGTINHVVSLGQNESL